MIRQKLTPQQALQKLKQYCAYQERSHAEAKEKLYGYGLRTTEVEQLLSQLIEEDYLNEERFAIQFAGGKFRMKKWGRVKIQYELKLKKVSAYNIKKALSAIDEEQYHQTLQQLTAAKWKSLAAEQYINRMAKTTQYMLQKGFEQPLIQQVIMNIREKKD
ncbi:MAG: RecX family transcriptional regulator [Bacteroidota bacterium]|nr:RecX family transcriptional regulator [Bacteroidota bacterium]